MALPRSLIPSNSERMSAEEYLRKEALAEFKSEYYDGFVVPLWPLEPSGMAGGSLAHTMLSGRILVLAGPRVRAAGCELFSSELKIRTATGRKYVYPDAAVVCDPEYLDSKEGAVTNPQIVFEVLSPSTEHRDRTIKFELYASIPTIQTIVLISSELRMVEVFTRHTGTAWLREAYVRGSIPLPYHAEFTLEDLYEGIPGLED